MATTSGATAIVSPVTATAGQGPRSVEEARPAGAGPGRSMPDAIETRRILFEATLQCALESGFNFSLENVAGGAGLSRATIYRYFPGGKDQLISESIAYEVGRFFTRIEQEVRAEPDVNAKIVRALAYGRDSLDHHELLQKVLSEDPERLLPELELTMPIVFDGIRAYVRSLLEHERLVEGVDVDEAAEYVARMFLTYLGSEGSWDLSRQSEVSRLVRTQFVAGILA
jgi:AcrR family transcriptional regulator